LIQIRADLYQRAWGVVEIDFQSYFTTIPHDKLLRLIRQRVVDGSMLRLIKQKTARQRLSRGFKRIAQRCRHNRHLPVSEQHRELCRKLQGHFAYYGITGNGLC